MRVREKHRSKLSRKLEFKNVKCCYWPSPNLAHTTTFRRQQKEIILRNENRSSVAQSIIQWMDLQ